MTIAALLLAALLPLGVEQPVSAIELIEPPRMQSNARVATSGGGHLHLAVWTDTRSGTGTIYGARFARDGRLLDSNGGFRIGEGAGADVIWTGRSWLVSWLADPLHARSATVDIDGTVGTAYETLTSTRLPLRQIETATTRNTVLVASHTGAAMVVTQEGKPSRFAPSGGFTSAENGFGVASSIGFYLAAGVADTTPVIFAVATDDLGRDRGFCCGGNSNPPAVPPTSVALAGGDSSYLLVRTGPDVSADFRGLGGHVLETSLLSAGRADSARVTRRGTLEYLVTFRRGGALFAIRTTWDGKPIGSPTPRFAFSAEEADVDAVVDGSGAAVWIESGGGVRGGVFDSVSIAAGAPFHATTLLGRIPAPQRAPRLMRVGDRTIAAWIEPKQEGDELRIAALGSTPRIVTRNAGAFDVVSDGDHVWALWLTGNVLNAQRYTHELEPVDSTQFTAPEGFTGHFDAAAIDGQLFVVWQTPDRVVTTDGTHFVVAWIHEGNEIRAVRHAVDGSLVDAEPLTLARGVDLSSLRAASNLLAWQSRDATYMARFGEEPRVVADIGSTESTLGRIAAREDGGAYLAWSHVVDGTATLRLESVSADLVASGSLTALSIEVGNAADWYDVAAEGTQPVVIYSKLDDGPRVFVRRGGVTRRRAVR